jgi:DNA mismatch repair protein MutL
VFEAVYYTVKRALEESEYRPQMQLGASKPLKNALGAFVAVGQDTKGEQISAIPTVKERVENTYPQKSVETYQYTPSKTQTNEYSYRSSANEINFDKPLKVASGAAEHYNTKSRNDAHVGNTETVSPSKSMEILKKYSQANPAATSITTLEDEPAPNYKYVGEAFDCYVMIEYEGDLLVIDKHAAHERIIFEQIKENRKKDGRIASQSLLLPITVILTPDEYSAVRDFANEFKSVGYDFYLTEKSADINSIPDAITVSDAEGLFLEMVDEIIKGSGNPENTESIRRERSLYQIACKAAIKGGRKYDRALIDWLVSRVLALDDVVVCPHGRPIAYRLTKTELDRQFNRIK